MIRKIRNWLCNKFLPIYLRDSLLEENTRLHEEVRRLRTVIQEKDAYIDGLRDGIKSQRRIVINTTGKEGSK